MTTEIINSDTNRRRAVIDSDWHRSDTAEQFEVFFGTMIAGEFQLSRFNPPRVYKSLAGARRSAERWIAR